MSIELLSGSRPVVCFPLAKPWHGHPKGHRWHPTCNLPVLHCPRGRNEGLPRRVSEECLWVLAQYQYHELNLLLAPAVSPCAWDEHPATLLDPMAPIIGC